MIRIRSKQRTESLISDPAPASSGKLLFAGTYDEILKDPKSITGRYLSGEMRIPVPNTRHKPAGKFLRLHGVTLHNLKNVDAMIPLGTLTVVTGVSGSG